MLIEAALPGKLNAMRWFAESLLTHCPINPTCWAGLQKSTRTTVAAPPQPGTWLIPLRRQALVDA
jgi:hypothetical protein